MLMKVIYFDCEVNYLSTLKSTFLSLGLDSYWKHKFSIIDGIM